MKYLVEKLKWLIQFLYEVCVVIYRDVTGIIFALGIVRTIKGVLKTNKLVSDQFRQLVKQHPDKPCLVYEDQTWTFKDVENYSNKIANLFAEKFNLRKGDCVALLMDNKPEYVGIWLGLSKIGVVTAFINTNLRANSLLHSINTVKSKCLIYGNSLEAAIQTIKQELNDEISLIVDESQTDSSAKLNLIGLLKDVGSEFTVSTEQITARDSLFYVFTSGTTGLPKAAIVKQYGYHAASLAFFEAATFKPEDRIYLTLPIYHSTGNTVGIGAALLSGATVVLRKKFSASNFWKECIQYDCTAFVYVGELCRFLVNQPPSPLDRQHRIRVAIGNGLRANVWREFIQRFNIKCIEFYGSSEGNCAIVNKVNKIGACGYIPLINQIQPFVPLHLIRVDETSDEVKPIRDPATGFCVPCKPGEKGVLVCMIVGSLPTTQFNGYLNNQKDTSKKILENVFNKGQRAFITGDLMVCDRFGYVYFCDRLGDTFRWRGENVSTVEVENCISKSLDSIECYVYGVEIPGEEGRAGMCAIKKVPEQTIDLNKLSDELKTQLPVYARPLFVRYVDDFEHTGTFKAKKNKLVQEGYDVHHVNDHIYYFDSKLKQYQSLSHEVYDKIQNRSFRF